LLKFFDAAAKPVEEAALATCCFLHVS